MLQDLEPTLTIAGLAFAAGLATALAWNGLRRRRRLRPEAPELLEQLRVGVVVCDAVGEVVHCNRFAEALLALPNPVGRRLEEIERRAFSHPTRSIAIDQTALRHDGAAYGTVTLLEDHTERAATWRRLEVASRFEALGFLVAGVAHEVNNPLAYVRSNLGMLKPVLEDLAARAEELPLSDDERDALREAPSILADATEGSERIGELVQRLRSFSREDSDGPVRDADLSVATHRALEMARLGTAGDLLGISHEELLPRVQAREADLVQIILQLLINALEASGARGAAPPRGRVEIELRQHGAEAVLHVMDRGPGIAPELLSHVFDPFVTTKHAGHKGLGLSISYDLARQNHARLEVRNRPNGGAAFSLWLRVDGPTPA